MAEKTLYTSSLTSVSVKPVNKDLSLGTSTMLSKMQIGMPYIKGYSGSYNSDNFIDFYFTDGSRVWYFNSRKSQVWDDYTLLMPPVKNNVADFRGVTDVIYNNQHIKQIIYNRTTLWQRGYESQQQAVVNIIGTLDLRLSYNTIYFYVLHDDIKPYLLSKVKTIHINDEVLDGAQISYGEPSGGYVLVTLSNVRNFAGDRHRQDNKLKLLF